MRKEILGLSVSCKFYRKGCDWDGSFGELKSHLKWCTYNATHCEYCSKALRPDEIESHKKGACPELPKKCPVRRLGCKSEKKMTPRELNEHMELNKSQHMEILVEKVSQLELVAYSARPPQGKRRDPDGSYDSGFGSLGRSLDEVEVDCITDSRFIKKSSRVKLVDSEDRSYKSEIATLRDELKAKNNEIEGLRNTVLKLEKSMRAKNADFEDRDFRLSLIENSNYDGTMVWKIPQFNQRMTDAQSGKYTSIFSLPFYSGRYGYKMCLRLYILGDGIGKGNYMSLFFVLMKGEFDNILQWPFTNKVTFKLINQGNGRDVVDTFQPDPMSSSFRKPKSDMNIASGCPRFVSHTDLRSGGYIFEDTIFIKCIVDTTTVKHP